MNTTEAKERLRNAAWLGTNEERDKIEEAVEVAIQCIEATEVLIPMLNCKLLINVDI